MTGTSGKFCNHILCVVEDEFVPLIETPCEFWLKVVAFASIALTVAELGFVWGEKIVTTRHHTY